MAYLGNKLESVHLVDSGVEAVAAASFGDIVSEVQLEDAATAEV